MLASPSARRRNGSHATSTSSSETMSSVNVLRRANASSCCVSLVARPVAASDAFSSRRILARGRSPPDFEGRADHLHAADDDREQIVEVVRDAAGELADRLQLLRVPQHLFGLAALGDSRSPAGDWPRSARGCVRRPAVPGSRSAGAAPARHRASAAAPARWPAVPRVRSAPPGSRPPRRPARNARSCELVTAADVCSTAMPGCADLIRRLTSMPLNVRQHDIEQHQVRRCGAALLDRRHAGCGLGDAIAVLAQHMRLQIATAIVVIDDQDVGRRHRSCGANAGLDPQDAVDGIDQRAGRKVGLRHDQRCAVQQGALAPVAAWPTSARSPADRPA